MWGLFEDSDRTKQRRSILLISFAVWAISTKSFSDALALTEFVEALASKRLTLGVLGIGLTYFLIRLLYGLMKDRANEGAESQEIEKTKAALALLQPHCIQIASHLEATSANSKSLLAEIRALRDQLPKLGQLEKHSETLEKNYALLSQLEGLRELQSQKHQRVSGAVSTVLADLSMLVDQIERKGGPDLIDASVDDLKSYFRSISMFSARQFKSLEEKVSEVFSEDLADPIQSRDTNQKELDIVMLTMSYADQLTSTLRQLNQNSEKLRHSCGFEISDKAIKQAEKMTSAASYGRKDVNFANAIALLCALGALKSIWENSGFSAAWELITKIVTS